MKLIKLLLEGKELELAKEKVMNIINSEIKEAENKDVQNLLFKYMEEIGDDTEKLNQVINLASTLARKDQLTTKAINNFFKSEYGRRLLSDKALAKDAPKRKNTKDLRIDKVEAFEDITDKHVLHKSTASVLKYVFKFTFDHNSSIENKEQYVDDLADPSKLIKAEDFLKPVAIGNIDDLLSDSITSNPIYKDIKQPLFDLNGKGIGKGEALLIAHSAYSGDAPSNKGDIVIGGKYFEVKNADTAGSIDSGLSSAKLDIDKHNLRFLTDVLGLSQDQIDSMNVRGGKEGGKKTKGVKMLFTHPIVKDKLTVDNLVTYFTPIYTNNDQGLSQEDLRRLASDVLSVSTNNEREAYAAIAPYVYNLYKNKKGFDGLIMIKPNGDYISFTDQIPEEVSVVGGMFVRGGNNQSLPVGYINLSF